MKDLILIVEDDPVTASLHRKYLVHGGYHIEVIDNGRLAIDLLEDKQLKPAMILLDVELPDMNGFAVCHKIKASSSIKDIPIIFISSHDSIDNITEGYDAGAVNYLVKPVQAETLIAKIRIALDTKAKIYQLSHQTDELTQFSMSMLNNVGEYGVIIDFLKKINSIEMPVSIVELLLSSISKFGLIGMVQVRFGETKINKRVNDQALSEMDMKILRYFNPNKPIVSSGSSLVINYELITLCINNMPKEDDDLCGRLRDHLAKIVESADEKISYLLTKQAIKNYLSKSIDIVKTLEDRQAEYKNLSINMMENVSVELEGSFIRWGLTEEQEKVLISIVENNIDESYKLFEQGQELDKKQHNELSIIIGILQALY